jgi:hypothetical protein
MRAPHVPVLREERLTTLAAERAGPAIEAVTEDTSAVLSNALTVRSAPPALAGAGAGLHPDSRARVAKAPRGSK